MLKSLSEPDIENAAPTIRFDIIDDSRGARTTMAEDARESNSGFLMFFM